MLDELGVRQAGATAHPEVVEPAVLRQGAERVLRVHLEALRSRAQLYREVLAVEVADLDKTLGELTTKVEDLLDRKSAAAA